MTRATCPESHARGGVGARGSRCPHAHIVVAAAQVLTLPLTEEDANELLALASDERRAALTEMWASDAVKDAVEAAWVAAKQAKIAARKARKKSLRSHYDEVLAIEASEEANIAAREARKQKRRAEVAVAVGEACAFKLSCAHVRS